MPARKQVEEEKGRRAVMMEGHGGGDVKKMVAAVHKGMDENRPTHYVV